MTEFKAAEYKQRLMESTSCDTCEKVPRPKLPPHKEVFVCRRYCDRFWSQYLLLCYTASLLPLVLP